MLAHVHIKCCELSTMMDINMRYNYVTNYDNYDAISYNTLVCNARNISNKRKTFLCDGRVVVLSFYWFPICAVHVLIIEFSSSN